MNSELLPNEKVIKKDKANMQKGKETVGGQLILTQNRMIFEPHKLNIQKHTLIINLSEIKGISKCWTKFLNVIPVYPNSICVELTNNNQYKMVCNNREMWIELIEKQVTLHKLK